MVARVGHPKWGGRQAGTPNKVTIAERARIQEQGDPVGFLVKIVKGRKIRGEYPTIAQRMRAAEKLMGKVVPELKAVELTLDSSSDVGIGEEARQKVFRLMEAKVQRGVLEGLRRFGLSDVEAMAAAECSSQVTDAT
ncbi:MAG: hypothetical protein ACJ0UT_10835 [Candidatus Latescibacterota bacterium]